MFLRNQIGGKSTMKFEKEAKNAGATSKRIQSLKARRKIIPKNALQTSMQDLKTSFAILHR